MSKSLEHLLYQLDWVDYNIIEQLVVNEFMLPMPVLIKRLKRINVGSSGIIRRKVNKLKENGLVFMVNDSNPIIVECYNGMEKDVILLRTMLRERLILIKTEGDNIEKN